MQRDELLKVLLDIAEELRQEVSWAIRNDKVIVLRMPGSDAGGLQRLEQMLAALTLIVTGNAPYEELSEACDALSVWAIERFHADAFAETLGFPEEPVPAPPPEQGQLFPQESDEE
jgi:hypothetical protein